MPDVDTATQPTRKRHVDLGQTARTLRLRDKAAWYGKDSEVRTTDQLARIASGVTWDVSRNG